jgi:hypothetical protein
MADYGKSGVSLIKAYTTFGPKWLSRMTTERNSVDSIQGFDIVL